MNKTSDYKFTIVVPVYNEEDNMDRLESAFSDYLPKCPMKACVLFVDDGSRDGSLSRIKEMCSRHDGFFYIAFKRNCGLSAAIKAGFDAAESEYVGYIDADLQTTPEDFNLLLGKINGHDMATGIRANRKDTGFKRFQSKFANGFRRSMTHDGATDTGCPLKVLKASTAKKIPFFKGLHRFLPAMVLMVGGTYVEMPVRHFPRTAGVSKFSLSNRLVGPLMDCFAYRWMRSRYIDYSIADSSINR